MRYMIAGIFLSIFLTVCLAQHPSYLPGNEVSRDASLAKMVEELSMAIDNRDHKYLLSILDPEVVCTFDSENGIAVFQEMWKPEQPESLIWPKLRHVIDLGGVFLQDDADESGRYQFVFPYVYDMEIHEVDDYFILGLITGQKVNLREGPELSAGIIGQLSHEPIRILPDNQLGDGPPGLNPIGGPEWYPIEKYDRNLRGWVFWKYVYTPMDFRVFLFKNKDGEWKISALLEGD